MTIDWWGWDRVHETWHKYQALSTKEFFLSLLRGSKGRGFVVSCFHYGVPPKSKNVRGAFRLLRRRCPGSVYLLPFYPVWSQPEKMPQRDSQAEQQLFPTGNGQNGFVIGNRTTNKDNTKSTLIVSVPCSR